MIHKSLEGARDRLKERIAAKERFIQKHDKILKELNTELGSVNRTIFLLLQDEEPEEPQAKVTVNVDSRKSLQ